jgi:hypothetical protein
MKKIYTLAFTLFLLFLKGQYYFQYFDGANISTFNSLLVSIQTNTANIWQIGKPQKALFSSASTTPNVIVTDTINGYPTKNVSSFTVLALHYNNFVSAPYVLQWKQKLDMDSKKDGGIVEFSNNGGVIWQNVHNNPGISYQFYGFQPANKDTINSNEYCFSGTDNVWRDIWLCIKPSVANMNDTLLFRFTFKSDSINTNKEGWMIDNFLAHKTIIHPVKEISEIDNIVVYPNITNGIVNIEMKKKADTDAIQNLQLFNSEGKLIETYGPNYTKVVLDISKHKAGMYYLHVTINKKVSKFKILYEKN